MNDSKEEITVISEEAEIALEDGEIEEEIEETVVEPISAIVCDEAVVDADNNSDVENCDRLKPKKHKHHHKDVHRKRLLSTDGGSTTDSWKRARSDDEFPESKPYEKLNDPPLFEYDNVNMETEKIEKCTWKHDSDEDDFASKSSNKFVNEETFSSEKRKERSFDDDDSNKNVDKHKDSFCGSPVVKESWGADSDEDCTKPSQGGNSNWVNNDTKDDTSNDWGNKNNEKKSWNNDNDDKGWGNKNDDNNKGWGNRNDNNRGWGNRNDGNRSNRGNRNDNNRGWGNRDDNNSNGDNNDDNKGDWGNRNEGNRGWGNRNDDNSGYGNRRGGRNNWGNRNDDGNNRGFRGRGRNNWRNRNEDNNSWSNKNDDNNSWSNKNDDNNSLSNKNDDNNSWSNKNRGNTDSDNNNRDGNDWSNKNSESNDWSSKGRDNNDWGNKGNNDCNDTNRNENDDWKKSSNDADDRAKSEEKEVVEKQAWGYDSDNEDTPATQNTTNVSKEKSPNFFNESNRNCNDTFGDEDRNNKSSYNDEKCNKDVSSNEPVKVRDIDDFGKWGGFDSDEEEKKPKEVASTSQSHFNNDNQDKSFDKPANKGSPENSAKWDYDSDEANNPKPQPQRSFNNDNNNSGFDNSPNKNKNSGFSKWGDVNSDDETKSTPRDQNNDDDDKGGFGNYGKRSFDNNRNNRNDNFNNRNDNFNRNNNNRNDNFNRNDNNRGGFNRNDNNRGGGGGGKKWPCKYFQMGSCRHGDNCSFLHDSPGKTQSQNQSQSQSQEPKIQELCRFYEHQECYKRNACAYMHEEFPCKLFHAGSKMCPSGDSCKYSHSPLTPETRAMLGKYLDEKIDERTDKSTSGSIHDNSDYKANNITPCPEDMIDPYFQDPMQHMYPQGPDPMNFPIRPWNPMMPYGDMPMPHAMEYMQRQRFMMDRYPQSMPGRMMPRGFRGMMGNASHGGPMNDPYNSNPYSVTPLMPPGYGGGPMKDRMGGGMPDPYIDNLAQLVVGKDARPVKLDPLDDMDDYEGLGGQRRRALSPLKINSPEIPPGAYVPRNSMNAVQPNVRLGGVPIGGGDAALMGGYGVGYGGGAGAGHPGADSAAMMDYINMAAIHYYHNQGGAGGLDHLGGFERPWKLLLLEVPVKVPYPLMQIDTGDLPHRQIDPRLRGHPSVLATGGGGGGQAPEDPSDTMVQSAQLTSQLSSPLQGSTDGSDIERQLSASYQYRSGQESPVFPLSEEAFNSFLGGPDDAAKRTLDRSYLQDPRFKRKKAVTAVTPEHLADSLD